MIWQQLNINPNFSVGSIVTPSPKWWCHYGPIDLNFSRHEIASIARGNGLNNVLRRIALTSSIEPQIRDERPQVLSTSYFKPRYKTQLKVVYTNRSAVRLILRAGCYYRMVNDPKKRRFASLEGDRRSQLVEARKIRLSFFSKRSSIWITNQKASQRILGQPMLEVG